MKPFLELRLWLRTGPAGERFAAAVVAVVFVGLLGWAAVPSEMPDDGTTAVASDAPSPTDALAPGTRSTAEAVAGASGPVAATAAPPSGAMPSETSPGGTTASAVASASTGASDRCSGLTATDQGVTPTELQIAVILVSIQGAVGNSLVGVPGPDDQRRDFEAVFADVNRSGGIACRKVVPTYHEVNPIDASNQHAACLDIVADRAFAVLNVGAFNPLSNRDCLPQNKIPLVDVVPLVRSEADRYRPYLFSYTAAYDRVLRNFVQAAAQRKWFDGAGKVGLLEKSCDAEFNTQMVAELGRIGIGRDRVVEFDYGCPPAVVPPNQIQQAVLEFKTSGVTHVVDVITGTLTDFSKAAAGQRYEPEYGIPDGGVVATTQNPNNRPDPSVDGALAVTPYAYGAENSGQPLGPATDRCDRIMKGAGLKPVVEQGVAIGGTICSLVWMLQAAAERAPSLTRASLIGGLNAVGKLELSFPVGPADFSVPGTTTGGQFWRPLHYVSACGCWKLLDVAWRPSF